MVHATTYYYEMCWNMGTLTFVDHARPPVRGMIAQAREIEMRTTVLERR